MDPAAAAIIECLNSRVLGAAAIAQLCDRCAALERDRAGPASHDRADGASVFVQFGLPGGPGPHHAYFLELSLPSARRIAAARPTRTPTPVTMSNGVRLSQRAGRQCRVESWPWRQLASFSPWHLLCWLECPESAKTRRSMQDKNDPKITYHH